MLEDQKEFVGHSIRTLQVAGYQVSVLEPLERSLRAIDLELVWCWCSGEGCVWVGSVEQGCVDLALSWGFGSFL